MKNGRFKHLTLMSFIIVLIIVIADTAICARKDMNRKSQKAASVISSQKNGEDGNDKFGDTAETTKKDNSQSIINISGQGLKLQRVIKEISQKIHSESSSKNILYIKMEKRFHYTMEN